MFPLTIRINPLEFKNIDSAENLIRYITRTRPNEDRRHELIAYGFTYGNSYSKPIEEVIREFEFVQKIYSATGCLMCHYVIRFNDKHFNLLESPIQTLNEYASNCCNILFQQGFQCCYAIHKNDDEELPHIHLAINTVNYTNGRKLRQYPTELYKNIELPLQELFVQYLRKQSTILDLFN